MLTKEVNNPAFLTKEGRRRMVDMHEVKSTIEYFRIMLKTLFNGIHK
jgi:hypothetical protein